MNDTVHVAVADIINQADEVCISLRHQDVHQGGLWELPGGKVEKHESVEAALTREIKEELDIDIQSSSPLITITHDYADKKVCLHVQKVFSFEGEAIGAEDQQVRWVPVNRLTDYEFPAANIAIISALQLPARYLITGDFVNEDDFLKKLSSALTAGIRLVQLRLKADHLSKIDDVRKFIIGASDLCLQADAQILLNLPDDLMNTIDFSKIVAAGIHADSKTLMALSNRPEGDLFSASCHSVQQLLKAQQMKADFVVLSPVQKTSSHPEAEPIGWQLFEEMTKQVAVPVYALGGVSSEDIAEAQLRAGQGVAAISAFWNAGKETF